MSYDKVTFHTKMGNWLFMVVTVWGANLIWG